MGNEAVYVNGQPIEVRNNELNLSQKNIQIIQEIHGLQNVKNLVKLNLRFNQIKEINGLDHLSTLQVLWLSNNQITAIQGLDRLKNLTELEIDNNQIAEIQGLETLTKLRTLKMASNRLGEIKGLETLVDLRLLNLEGNQITEIKGLENSTKLLTLILEMNQISEIQGLKTLKNLQELNLYSNNITELKGLEASEKLQTLNLNNNPLKEHQYAQLNHPKEIAEIRQIYINKLKESKPLERVEKDLEQPIDMSKPQIFIVHGHDNAMKYEVARTLEKLGLNPVILHEQPNEGRTILEKFEDYSDVPCTIVLLSPDDIGFSKSHPEKPRSRARQNVIFELGFFFGKLKKDRVIVLHKNADDFDMLTDLAGILYLPYNEQYPKEWQYALVKELLKLGYKVDSNKLP